MGTVQIHPRLEAGQAAIVARLNKAVLALRDDGIESLIQAKAALRLLGGDGSSGARTRMAAAFDLAIMELAAIGSEELPTIAAILRLEQRLTMLSQRVATLCSPES